jgi:3-hydroxybutyrate dehydrogenase
VSRAALVTGAASGIGAAIAERLRKDGWDVLTVDVRGEVGYTADLTTRAGNEGAVATAVERFGRLDAVIPNAGFQHVAPIAEFPVERWEAMLALMLTSPFLLARCAWPHLRDSPEGRFVAIASVHGLVASPFKAAYVSAKHGLLGLIKTLALEGAPHGIAATAVCPGYVRTPLVEAQIADQARVHDTAEERVLEEVILRRQAVKRLIEPEEVGAVVAFLLGPQGRAFTGAPVTMDQGWTAS